MIQHAFCLKNKSAEAVELVAKLALKIAQRKQRQQPQQRRVLHVAGQMEPARPPAERLAGLAVPPHLNTSPLEEGEARKPGKARREGWDAAPGAACGAAATHLV